MLISMTGYGDATAVRDGMTVTVQVRSVNNRFLEVSAKVPRTLQSRENEIKELVRTRLSRGKITVAITLDLPQVEQLPVTVNLDAARAYFGLLSQLRETVGMDAPVTLDHLMKFSEVLTVSESGQSTTEQWELVSSVLDDALIQVRAMREREGETLRTDLRQRIDGLERCMLDIEQKSGGRVERERDILRERIAQLIDSTRIDPDRLEMEVVIFADKVDITEELVRFRSHLTVFREALDSPESEGRKLGFLLQEMNREANTIASKAYDAGIAHVVVHIKEELERIREQLQNIE